ncbi:MAG: AAA family ATPase [Nitrospirae bacterium]|nr:AAA family ATPase [Candidatus Manganitrophaceae bacterium]
MLLLAIDFYGIEPFHKPTRLPVKPGLNIVTGANGAGKTAVLRILSSLLFGTELTGVRWVENQPAQAAVILQAKDKATYRITGDYQKGIFNLSRLDPSGQKTLIEKDRKKITAWVCDQAGGLSESHLLPLFLIDRLQFPSIVLKSNGSPKPTVATHGSAASAAGGPVPLSKPAEKALLTPETRAEKERRLEEIRQKLEELGRCEEEMLNARDKVAELKRRLNQLNDLTLQENQVAEAETKRFAGWQGIEITRPELFRQYEEGLQQKQNGLTQLEEEKEEMQARLMQIGETDLFQDRHLQVGVILTILSFLLPIFITLHGPFRYLFPIGVLGGIGLSLFAYFQLHQRDAAKSGLEKKLAGMNEKINSVNRKFDKEYKEVTDLLSKSGCKDIQELKERQRAYQQHVHKKKELAEKRESLLKGGTVEIIAQQAQEGEAAFAALEAKLQGFTDLNEELYRLEEALRLPDSNESQQIEMPDLGPLPAAGSEPSPTPFLSVMTSLAKQRTPPLSFEQIEKQTNILYALFDRSQSRAIHLKENGEINVSAFGLHQVSSGTADQIFIALILATLDHLSETPFPLFLDEPFSILSPASQATALELLRGAARRRQVVLLSVHPFSPKGTDHSVDLSAL